MQTLDKGEVTQSPHTPSIASGSTYFLSGESGPHQVEANRAHELRMEGARTHANHRAVGEDFVRGAMEFVKAEICRKSPILA